MTVKDKFGIKLKYPERDCKNCLRYPCFAGIDRTVSNFAAYGCLLYK